MDFKAQQLIGVNCIKLVQRRFSDGSLYLCAICLDGELVAIDVRYFTEDGNSLIPTRQGFRVHKGEFNDFLKLLSKDVIDIEEVVLWETGSKKLVMRYCDDQFGTAIDFRYYKTSEKYTGWERRGIRLQLEDYKKLQMAIVSSNLLSHWVLPKTDLLIGKEISSARSESRVIGSAITNKDKSVKPNLSDVNVALRSFIEEL